MKFILHTIIDWNGISVYYNVYQTEKDHYLAQILDNPHEVENVDELRFWLNEAGEWFSEGQLDYRQIEILGETIESYLIDHK